MSSVPSVSAASAQEALALLQAQMQRYSQSASSQNPTASADYRALQNAIKAGNVSDAQAALARLQRDSLAGKSSANTAPVDSDGDHDGSKPGLSGSRSINTTA